MNGNLGNSAQTHMKTPVWVTGITNTNAPLNQLRLGEYHSCAVPVGVGVFRVAPGKEHACAAAEFSGQVFCWGLNHVEQVGNEVTNLGEKCFTRSFSGSFILCDPVQVVFAPDSAVPATTSTLAVPVPPPPCDCCDARLKQFGFSTSQVCTL